MSNIYFISPIGLKTPLLYDTFIDTFTKEGHSVSNNVKNADVVFFDMHSRGGKYDWDILNDVLELEKPIVVFDFWDYGAMSKDTWFGFNNFSGLALEVRNEWAYFLSKARIFCKMVYFMRKMDLTLTYPNFVYPLELVQYPDNDFPVTTKEELMSRPYDLCWIGNTSNTRANLLTGLMGYKTLHIDCHWTQDRLPNQEWLNRHMEAKFFIEACGGGFGSERPYQLINISPMLRAKNNQLIVNNFVDGEDCVEVSENPTGNDVDKILFYLNDADKLYDIYLKGVQKIKQYFSPEERSFYILDILKQNNII